MNKKVAGIAVILMFGAMLALSVSAVSATKPTEISGKWKALTSAPISDPKDAGANRFTYSLVTGEYFEGPIIGAYEHTIESITHFGEPEQLPPSTFNWKMDRTFSGTVYDKEGTLLIRLTAKGTMPMSPSTLEGKWVIISGTEELANLHGQGTFTNLGGSQFSYEGQIHFDP